MEGKSGVWLEGNQRVKLLTRYWVIAEHLTSSRSWYNSPRGTPPRSLSSMLHHCTLISCVHYARTKWSVRWTCTQSGLFLSITFLYNLLCPLLAKFRLWLLSSFFLSLSLHRLFQCCVPSDWVLAFEDSGDFPSSYSTVSHNFSYVLAFMFGYTAGWILIFFIFNF